jgi:surface antigen
MFSHAVGIGGKQMHQQTALLFYKFRLLFAGILIIALLLLISSLVTAIGSNTILDTRTHASVSTLDTNLSENPNAVVTSAYQLVNGAQHMMLATGTAFYGACKSITVATAQTGRSAVHGSAVVVRGIGSGVAFVGRGFGNAVMFTLHTAGSGTMFMVRLPGTIVASVTHVTTVSAIIRPADDKQVPVISNKTSAATLASLSTQQQQQIASWQAAQIAANRGLGGLLVAGDPSHGGYPARWDNAPQDSTVDSWGMYSRECVSYAAWKVYQTYGNMPYWGGVGNANQWVNDAKRVGIATGSAPQAHSVAISMRGYYGHAMWVEKVSGDMIYVSQYNYDLHGHYSEMWVNASSFTYIYFK